MAGEEEDRDLIDHFIHVKELARLRIGRRHDLGGQIIRGRAGRDGILTRFG